MKRLFHENPQLKILMISQLAYFLIGAVIILIFSPDRLVWLVSFLAGVLYGCFGLIHICHVLNQIAFMPQNMATRHFMGGYAVRQGVMIGVFALCWLMGSTAMLVALAGMFSMKVSAYIEPFTDRVLQKYNRKGR